MVQFLKSHALSLFAASALVIIVLFVVATKNSGALASPERIEIRWLLPHPSKSLFDNATTTLARILEKEGNNIRFKESLVVTDIGIKPTSHQFMQFVDTEPAGIVSDYVGHLSGMDNPGYSVLDLPFLFKDYKTATDFLDGPGGKELLDQLSASSSYKALAFSMSGGMRLFVSRDKNIRQAKDLKGLRVYTGFGGKTIVSTLKAFGTKPSFDSDVEFYATPELLKDYDLVETTYSRVPLLFRSAPDFAKYVIETNHSLALTVMIVSRAFYDSLSEQNKRALEMAAHEAARIEKQDSILSETAAREQARKAGVTVITLSPEERATFEAAAQLVRKELDPEYKEFLDILNSH